MSVPLATAGQDAPGTRLPSRGRVTAEVLIVLGLSLGQSAVYAVVTLINRLTYEVPLRDQTTTLNPSRDSREIFDLIYQVLSLGFALVPVALVCWLLWRPDRPRLGRLGIDAARPGRDLAQGAGLALLIGIPSGARPGSRRRVGPPHRHPRNRPVPRRAHAGHWSLRRSIGP